MKKLFSKISSTQRPSKTTKASLLLRNNRPAESSGVDDDDVKEESSDDEGVAGDAAQQAGAKSRPKTNDEERIQRGIQNVKGWIQSKNLPEESDLSDPSNSEEDRHAEGPKLTLKPKEQNRMKFSSDSEDADDYKPADDPFQGSDYQPASSLGKSEKRRKSENFQDSFRSIEKVTYQLTDDSESTDDSELLPAKTGLLHGINIGSTIDSREIEKTLSVYSSSHSTVKAKRQRHGKDDVTDSRQTRDGLQFLNAGSYQSQSSYRPAQEPQPHRSLRMSSSGSQGSEFRTSRMEVEAPNTSSSRKAATKLPNINKSRMPESRFVRDDISDSSDGESEGENRPIQNQRKPASHHTSLQHRDIARESRSQESRRNDFDAAFDWRPPGDTFGSSLGRPQSANKSLNSSTDSDVLKISDSSESESETDSSFFGNSPAKLGSLKLEGVNDFDTFMKTVDKKVNKAVKIEKRILKSRNQMRSAGSSQPASEASEVPSRNVIPVISSSIPAKKSADLNFERFSRAKEASTPTAAPPDPLLQSSVGMRRQKLDQIKPGHGYAPAVEMNGKSRRPDTSHDEKKMAEQLEEMEMLQRQQKEAAQKEREQKEILDRLKREKLRRDNKHKEQKEELEKLWSEQAKQDDERFRREKEIERLKSQLKMKEDKEKMQSEELERLRREVAERARADALGAAEFDKLVAEKHKKLLVPQVELQRESHPSHPKPMEKDWHGDRQQGQEQSHARQSFQDLPAQSEDLSSQIQHSELRPVSRQQRLKPLEESKKEETNEKDRPTTSTRNQQMLHAALKERFRPQVIPGYSSAAPGGREQPTGAEDPPQSYKSVAAASHETLAEIKAKRSAAAQLKQEKFKQEHLKSQAGIQHHIKSAVRAHEDELKDAVQEARSKAELQEARVILKESARPAPPSIKLDTKFVEDMKKLEEEKLELERREQLQEAYIEQLKFEQQQKLEREEAKRKTLQKLRNENQIIDKMLRETDSLDGRLMKEVGTLETLKEQFKKKQELADKLRDQQEELKKKQEERERELSTLKHEVSKATNSAGIQLLQMERLKQIQEESRRLQEEKQQELQRLKEEIQMKSSIDAEAQELERLREEKKRIEESQAEARKALEQEQEMLEKAMSEQKTIAEEFEKLQREKRRREEHEMELRRSMVQEEREIERLKEEAENRRMEIERLHEEKQNHMKVLEGQQKDQLMSELAELKERKEKVMNEEARLRSEKRELEELNKRREAELRHIEELRIKSDELERQQMQAKLEEERALREKEERERERLRAKEDRIRKMLEMEAEKAKLDMELERKRRQAEIDKLKQEIQDKKITEEEEAAEEEVDANEQKINDWLKSSQTGGPAGGGGRAGDITERSMGNSSAGDGGMTDRSDATDGTMTSRGPASQFKLARYGKVKELEKVITRDNVDDRDDKGNTCLHHACMQNKKRIAKMVLRLGADINAQNEKGNTCLHYCFGYNYTELGEYLISKGADESIRNHLNATCREVSSSSMMSSRK